jgi:ankyrin repeat protein
MKNYIHYVKSQRDIQYIKESKSLENQWFKAVYKNNIEKVKEFINQGIDINKQNRYNITALIYASSWGYKEIVKLLLKHPNINLELKDNNNNNFITILKNKEFLIDYQLQKELLNNDRENIILFLDKYNLVHPKIKDENPTLFQASDWGLI